MAGAGMGLVFAPSASALLSVVSPAQAGQASGTNNAIREVGGVFGVAVLATVFSESGAFTSPQGFVDGVVPALWVASAVVGARRGHRPGAAPPRAARPARPSRRSRRRRSPKVRGMHEPLEGIAEADAVLGRPFPLPSAALPLARWVDVVQVGEHGVEVAWNLDDTRPGAPGRLALYAGLEPPPERDLPDAGEARGRGRDRRAHGGAARGAAVAAPRDRAARGSATACTCGSRPRGRGSSRRCWRWRVRCRVAGALGGRLHRNELMGMAGRRAAGPERVPALVRHRSRQPLRQGSTASAATSRAGRCTRSCAGCCWPPRWRRSSSPTSSPPTPSSPGRAAR